MLRNQAIITDMSEIVFNPDDTILPVEVDFQYAKTHLLNEHTAEYLSEILGSVEVDYEPIERILGLLTNLIDAKFERRDGTDNHRTISVIPRGSSATRTAVKGHIDLDIDVIFPDCHDITHDNQTSTIKQVLGTDETGENILFEKEGFVLVLKYFWNTLISGAGSINIRGLLLSPPGWLGLIKLWNYIT